MTDGTEETRVQPRKPESGSALAEFVSEALDGVRDVLTVTAVTSLYFGGGLLILTVVLGFVIGIPVVVGEYISPGPYPEEAWVRLKAVDLILMLVWNAFVTYPLYRGINGVYGDG